MENGILKLHGTEVRYSFLKSDENIWRQFYYSIVPEQSGNIGELIESIELAETELFQRLQIQSKTAVAKRLFLSDLINQYDEIIAYRKRRDTDFFMSLTEQPPVASIKVVLLGMCLNNIIDGSKARYDNIFYFDTEQGIKHIFAEHLIDPAVEESSNAEKQTASIFRRLENTLAKFGASIESSVLRTWIYAPHIDADYNGIVKARKEFFEAINLTRYTHYIASTGIQGGTGNRFARIFMDVYAATGIGNSKIRYIQAPEYLSPTDLYGVTFERATAIEMGGADFLFISGTASIDKHGDIVYPGEVAKQAEHTLVNISALLSAAGFNKTDLSSFIIYLRDPSDYGFVKPLIDRYVQNLPTIYVKASVCRPGWLLEIEATAARIKD